MNGTALSIIESAFILQYESKERLSLKKIIFAVRQTQDDKINFTK